MGQIKALAISILLTSTLGQTSDPSISTSLRASFPAPPLPLELLETAALENSTAYSDFLDIIATPEFYSTATDEKLFEQFKTVLQGKALLDAGSLSNFEFALGLRVAAPRVEASYQFYRETVRGKDEASIEMWKEGGLRCKDFQCQEVEKESDGGEKDHTKRELQFDRFIGAHSDAKDGETRTVYLDVTAADFPESYTQLKLAQQQAPCLYRVRYKPSISGTERKKLVVNGYGVELALKRTDYIVIDDRQQQGGDEEKDKERGDDKGDKEERSTPSDKQIPLNLENENAEAPLADLKPLSQSELLELGTKTGSYIMSSAETEQGRFKNLLRITQDFPRYAAALAGQNESYGFLKEHNANHNIMNPWGTNFWWLNGVQVPSRDIDAFSLLERIRNERKVIKSITNLGFSGSDSISLLSYPQVAEAQSGRQPQRYEFRDYIEGGGAIIWLNDITKDQRYKDWPSEAQALLQRTFQGQIPQVRRDIHNVIFPVDFTTTADASLVAETLQLFIQRGIGVRFGFVPRQHTKGATDQAKVVYHLREAYGLKAVKDYLQTAVMNSKLSEPDYTTFDSVTRSINLRENQTALSISEILSSSHLESRIDKAKSWLSRLGADGPNPPIFANGVTVPYNDDWLQAIGERISVDLRSAQEAVMEELLTDDDWIPQLWMKNAIIKRNGLIIPENESEVKLFNVVKLWERFGQVLEPRKMAALDDYDASEFVTMTLIADFSNSVNDVVLDVFDVKSEHKGLEVIVIPNPAQKSSEDAQTKIVKDAEERFSDSAIPRFLERAVKVEDTSGSTQAVPGPSALVEAVGLKAGETGILLNGRLVGPIPKDAKLTKEDLFTLVSYEQSKRIHPVVNAVKSLHLEAMLDAPLAVAKLSSVVALSTVSDLPESIFDSTPGPRREVYNQWNSSHTCIELGDKKTASLQFVVSLNPTSEVGQRWAQILSTLIELEGVHMRIFLNPELKLEELPVKRFYRHLSHSRPQFSNTGAIRDLKAEFGGLPEEALLTMGLDVPGAWVVAASECIHDLDNIKLSSLKGKRQVEAIYDLEYILIEGHSRDVDKSDAPPQGAQLVLGTDTNPEYAETIVMANLGYFQFKANPGVFNLALQKGRSEEIFKIDSAGTMGSSPQPGDETTEISLCSFQGATVFPRLSRKPGKQEEDVLEPSSTEKLASKGAAGAEKLLSKGLQFGQNILSKAGVSGSGGEGGILEAAKPKHADINIFSVASGHLYERMLNIMMVSVMRHTNSTVKFWFIEQFLSPSFKEFLPHVAEEYKFSYEMVTYKWPHWLRAQTEKQRVIWGYKILFLDVLFPLDLQRVIFVDADQVVRTDMLDLTNLPLDYGAPYAFTPMCDSREEMEGFRFWKQGYWRTFLRGLPYHISALYLVDLRRFREMAAGDRLRGQYHQLSADPGSLANLDQDLPNHMQATIPIHSLPQDWLWCETWCADEALKTAKTIDLCNNPMTKEPKLDRARRQLPEWTVYDEEIAALARRVDLKAAKADSGVHGTDEGTRKADREGKARDEL